MGRRCFLCGVIQVKKDENRSFHAFPAKGPRRASWLRALDKEDVPKTAEICSDHFDFTDFSDILGDIGEVSLFRRRLKQTAVPKRNLIRDAQQNSGESSLVNKLSSNIDVPLDDKDSHSKNSLLLEQNEEECNLMSVINDSEMRSSSISAKFPVQDDGDATRRETIGPECTNENVSGPKSCETSRKRKADFESDGHDFQSKKFCMAVDEKTKAPQMKKPEKKPKRYRVRTKNGNKWLSRDDFKTDEKWQLFQELIYQKNRSLRNVQRKRRRLVKKVGTFKDLITNLKGRNLLTSVDGDHVKASLAPGAKLLVESVLKGRRSQTFPTELRNFAMNLHFYSPNAYNYVRRSFMNCLPHPATLREWLKHFNFEPGISKEAIASVRRLIENSPKKLFFNLVLDEMAIRKHVRWNPKTNKFEGYVDIGRGDGESYDDAPEATNALVFMLVCINDYFKIPIAYYFVTTLPGIQKSTLSKEILCECHRNEIDVRHMTFDGHSTNINMAEDLGASIYDNSSSASFQNPYSKKTVYTTPDPCHMLKLVRNTVATSDLIDADGERISWKYVQKLVEVQEKEGLLAATKVKRNHIEFQNDKMKVNLAGQVLSSSTRAALNTLEFDLEYDGFEGAAPMARLCQVVNDSFDLLNSRAQFTKNPLKRAISVDNLEELKMKARGYINYLKALKLDGQPVWKSQRRTGFLGLIIGLRNVLKLAEDMFSEGCEFLGTYKLSQDHLEMFFAVIRRFMGLNDNPTTWEFKSAMRKLCSHVDIKIPLSGNCIPQDNTALVKIAATGTKTVEATKYQIIPTSELDEISVEISKLNLSDYVIEVVTYISGAVVRILKDKIRCETCLSALEISDQVGSVSVLQRRKTYGKLISASDDVIIICKSAEKVFRYQKSLKKNNIMEKMIVTTMHSLNLTDLFVKIEHTDARLDLTESDHRYQMIRMILSKYFTIRLHHAATTTKKFEPSVRRKNHNLTQFKNQ